MLLQLQIRDIDLTPNQFSGASFFVDVRRKVYPGFLS